MSISKQIEKVFIIGAGFSQYAGLPTQKEFTQALLDIDELKELGPSRAIVDYLRKFVDATFGTSVGAEALRWPELEDIFTNIDLAANTGHHLGSQYNPSKLRTLRRALIVRIIRMLKQKYSEAEANPTDKWIMLDNFFKKIDLTTSAFIVLNWDTIVEQKIFKRYPDYQLDYQCDAIWTKFPQSGRKSIIPHVKKESPVIPVVKIHGSINWLYCDNCRRLFSFPPHKTENIAQQLLNKEDWKKIDPEGDHLCSNLQCPNCPRVKLTTRLATFSYRKALEFPMFQKSWFSAASLLENCHKWIFIGYSLPGADYEFKHLLKRAELSGGNRRRKIVLITGGNSAVATAEAYKKFFGKITVFEEGITDSALSYLSRI